VAFDDAGAALAADDDDEEIVESSTPVAEADTLLAVPEFDVVATAASPLARPRNATRLAAPTKRRARRAGCGCATFRDRGTDCEVVMRRGCAGSDRSEREHRENGVRKSGSDRSTPGRRCGIVGPTTKEVAMFIQVITGAVTDPAGFHRETDRWDTELRPGATGFLGSTSGVTPDGRFVVFARFASEADARRNSDRPEQGAWWAEMEKTVSDVDFRDSVDIKLMLDGGSDDAGFVQVMRGHVKDAEKADALEAEMKESEDAMRRWRPDILGDVIVIHEDGTYTDAVYFTSEAAARAGEATPPPAELQAAFGNMEAAIAIDEYFDLPDPQLR
jgi:hypothetical protein